MSVLSRFTAQDNPNIQPAADKFSPFISAFIDDIISGSYTHEDRTVRLLAHSHRSRVTLALLDKAVEMADLGIKLELILADLPVSLDFEIFLNDIEPLLASENGNLSFRWIENNSLLDAHEQLMLGSHSSWSGDMLKRVSGNAYHVEIFESADQETIRLGQMAFSAMWMVSSLVPAHRLKRITSQNEGEKTRFLSQIASSLKAGKWVDTMATRH